VGGGLVAAAGAVEVGDGVAAEQTQRVRAPRRHVHLAPGRRGGHEEDVLAKDEIAMPLVDGGELLGHPAPLAAGER